MKRLSLMGLAALLLAACSSSPKPVAERVKETEKSMAKTDKILNDAQSEMTSFSKKLADLKEDAGGSDPMARRSRFESSIDRLSLAVQQAQMDMKDLQVNNSEKKKAFESRVNRALEPNAAGNEEPIYQAD